MALDGPAGLAGLGGGKPPEPPTSIIVGASENDGGIGLGPAFWIGASEGNCTGEGFVSELGGADCTRVPGGELEWLSPIKVGLSESHSLSIGSLILWFVTAEGAWERLDVQS